MLTIDFDHNGKYVIDRIIQAYGFNSKTEYCDYSGITVSNLSMKYKRDTFPSELVIKCMAETGVTLEWLATGKGTMFEGEQPAASESSTKTADIPCMHFARGKLTDVGVITLDKAFLPRDIKEPVFYQTDKAQYIADTGLDEFYDGRWMVEIDGVYGIHQVMQIPGGMQVERDNGTLFETELSKINLIARMAIEVKVI